VIVPGSFPFRGPFSGPAPGSLQAHRYDPGRNSWSDLPAGPDRDDVSVWTGAAMLVLGERPPAPSCQSHNCVPPSEPALVTSAWDAATGQWTDLTPLPALRVADMLPGSLTGAWTGRELLVLANLTGSAPSTSPGPGQDKGGAPHLVGLRFGP
jgi:hypothetical protein